MRKSRRTLKKQTLRLRPCSTRLRSAQRRTRPISTVSKLVKSSKLSDSIGQLEKIRSDVSDLELRYKEKKKNVKFAINLADEKEALEEIDNKADMMDE